jgi:hypothetical protein
VEKVYKLRFDLFNINEKAIEENDGKAYLHMAPL